jgi:ketosteroid isomerase-like protein
MKRSIATLILVSVSILLLSCTQNGEPSTASSATPPAVSAPPIADSPEKAEAEILQLERDWVAAIEKKDLAALDRILAEDFVGTSVSGGTFRKVDAIDDIKKNTYVVQSMNMDELSVNVYGTAAVTFASQDEKSTYAGKENSGHYHFTNTWIKKDGKWQVVASHGSRYSK